MLKLFLLGFVVTVFSGIFVLATLGARKEHDDWSKILSGNNSRSE